MPYLYAAMSAGNEKANPERWTLTRARDNSNFGIHTENVYLSFDKDAAIAMIKHLEMGIDQLDETIRF